MAVQMAMSDMAFDVMLDTSIRNLDSFRKLFLVRNINAMATYYDKLDVIATFFKIALCRLPDSAIIQSVNMYRRNLRQHPG